MTETKESFTDYNTYPNLKKLCEMLKEPDKVRTAVFETLSHIQYALCLMKYFESGMQPVKDITVYNIAFSFNRINDSKQFLSELLSLKKSIDVKLNNVASTDSVKQWKQANNRFSLDGCKGMISDDYYRIPLSKAVKHFYDYLFQKDDMFGTDNGYIIRDSEKLLMQPVFFMTEEEARNFFEDMLFADGALYEISNRTETIIDGVAKRTLDEGFEQ